MRSAAQQPARGRRVMAVLAAVGGLAACSSPSERERRSGAPTSPAAAGTGPTRSGTRTRSTTRRSDWAKLLDTCGTEAGVTIKRTGYDTTDLTNKALLAGAAGQRPDVLILDNPVVSTLAEAGVLDRDRGDYKLDVAAISTRTCSAPARAGGKTYGIPIGANTLALYYNKKVLDRGGRRPRLDQGLGVAHRGAEEGEGGRQEGHHVLGDRHRGGQLPVPALVLGRGRAASPSSTRPRPSRRWRCGPTG